MTDKFIDIETAQVSSDDLLSRYSELDARKAKLKDDLTHVEAELKELHEPLLTYFQQRNIQSHKANGRLLYLEQTRVAAKVDPTMPPQVIVDQLREAHFEQYAPRHVNWQGLGKFFRDLDDEGEKIPMTIAGIVQMDTSWKIKGRKA